jgi:hypothetical protein
MTLIIQKPTGAKLNLAKTFTWNETIWNPSMITTALWLDAADASTVTTVSGAVSQWNDKSGNSRHATQSTVNLRPTYSASGLNGKATLDWGDQANAKLLAHVGVFSPSRIYGVADWDGPSTFLDFNGLLTFDFSNNSDLPLVGTQNTTFWFANAAFLNGSSTASATALPTISSPFIFGTNSTPTASRVVTYIGADRNNQRSWLGKISEVIILSFVPNSSEKAKLEGYLAHKWGLAANLPADHSYKTVGPTP